MDGTITNHQTRIVDQTGKEGGFKESKEMGHAVPEA